MTHSTFRAAWGAAALVLLTALASCGGGGDGGISGTGVMRLSITDAPACGYNEVNVTIEKVRVNLSSNAADGDTGWSEIILSPAKRVDLLTLTNGVLEELGQVTLPAGRYTQLRLVLADNTPANPLANSVIPTGGRETALDTPSAQQSGLKLKVNMDVVAGQVADFAIDFDACKSVVKRGNSGRFNLKPVISVIPLLSDAGLRVVGYVDPVLALPSTSVSVQQGGVPIKATVPDASGTFVLYPVPAGNYELVVSAAGRVTAVMTGVPVVATSVTTVNSTSIAFLPTPSTATTVTGTVTPTTATVRALQSLTAGPTVEVAWASVDADTGLFQAVLSNQTPVRAPYAANATSLTWTPDAGAAGRYTVEASFNGATKTQSVNTLAPLPPVAFTFP